MKYFTALVIFLVSQQLWAENSKINQLSIVYKDSETVVTRIILQDKINCPEILVDGKAIATEELKNNSQQADRDNFLKVCLANVSTKSKKIEYQNQAVILPQGSLKKIAIIGDTGCRLKLSATGFDFQNCKDEVKWPFRKIADAVANEKADLVIHVGDYHYRESCADKKLCGPYLDTIGYTSKAWAADFLVPASKLLSQSPWIIVRGNHEDCNRAHTGYFYLLSGSGETFDKCPETEAEQYIQIGDTMFVNIDVSAVNDLPTMDPQKLSELINKFKEVKLKIDQSTAKQAWILLHKPIWGIAEKAKNIFNVNMNLAKIVEAAGFSNKTKFIFSGHVHNFQLSYKNNLPLQIVVGESGTNLDPAQLKNQTYERHDKFKVFIPTQKKDQFGYFLIDRVNETSPWQGHVKNINGQLEYNCNLSSGKCEKN